MRAALAKTLKATAQPALRANARAVSGLLEATATTSSRAPPPSPTSRSRALRRDALQQRVDQGRGHGRQGRGRRPRMGDRERRDDVHAPSALPGRLRRAPRPVGMVQNAFFKFDNDGVPVWDFKGKDLIQGETDGPRRTRRAGCAARTAPAATSRSTRRRRSTCGATRSSSRRASSRSSATRSTRRRRSSARSTRSTARACASSLLGYEATGLQSNIGLEQEIFLIPRDKYTERQDLMPAGRTIMGADAPRGQEMCDHYMAASSHATALACMQEIQAQCFRLGIPMRTRQPARCRSSARPRRRSTRTCDGSSGSPPDAVDTDRRDMHPTHWNLRYEFAPLIGIRSPEISGVMRQYGARALQEKPFNNINGSGKHNNWSIGTHDGVNFLNIGQITKVCHDDAFPDDHGRHRQRHRQARRPDAHGDRDAGQRLPPRRDGGAAGDRVHLPR